jgi:hypothetical protein
MTLLVSVVANAAPNYIPPTPYTAQDPFMMLQAYAPTNGAIVNCSTGTCSFDVPTSTNNQILGILKDATDVTRERYTGLIDDTKKEINELIKGVWSETGLLGIAASRAQMSPRTVEDLAGAYVAYQRQVSLIQADIDTLGSFFSEDMQGIPIADREKFVANNLEIKARGTLITLQNAFKAALVTINKQICKASFYLAFPTGEKQLDAHPVVCKENGEILTVDIKAKGQLLRQEDIDELAAKVREYSLPTDKVKNNVLALATITRETIQNFIKIYGAEQNSNANHNASWTGVVLGWFTSKNSGYNGENNARVTTEKQAYDELIAAFWMRSALRKSYGMPIGAIDIRYAHDKDNLDFWTAATASLSTFPEKPIFDFQGNATAALHTANLNYQYALNAAKSKAAAIAGSDSTGKKDQTLIIKGDFSVLDYANSVWETISNGGTLDHWKAIHLCLQLMAADLQEEMMVRQAGGMKKINLGYRIRYVDINEKEHPGERKRYIDLKKAFKNTLAGNAAQLELNDKNDDVAFQTDNDIRGKVRDLVLSLKLWTGRLVQARVFQATMDIATRADSSHEGQMVQERMDDL